MKKMKRENDQAVDLRTDVCVFVFAEADLSRHFLFVEIEKSIQIYHTHSDPRPAWHSSIHSRFENGTNSNQRGNSNNLCLHLFSNSSHLVYIIRLCASPQNFIFHRKSITSQTKLRSVPRPEKKTKNVTNERKKHIIGLGFDVLSQSGKMHNDPFRYLLYTNSSRRTPSERSFQLYIDLGAHSVNGLSSLRFTALATSSVRVPLFCRSGSVQPINNWKSKERKYASYTRCFGCNNANAAWNFMFIVQDGRRPAWTNGATSIAKSMALRNEM